jgi:hypothetical protein
MAKYKMIKMGVWVGRWLLLLLLQLVVQEMEE